MLNYETNITTPLGSLNLNEFAPFGDTARFPLDFIFGAVFGLPNDAPILMKDIPQQGLEIVLKLTAPETLRTISDQVLKLNLKSFVFFEKANNFIIQWMPDKLSGVSVVAALFNNDLSEFTAFLESVITAFDNCTADHKELVLVDDCSINQDDIKTKLGDFLPRFEEKKIRLKTIYKSQNSGPGAARNMGAIAAAEKNLLLVDSDDLIHPLYIQILAQELEAGSGFTSCDMRFSNGHFHCALASGLAETLEQNSNGACIGLRKDNSIVDMLIRKGELYSNKRLSHYEDWELNVVLKGLGLKMSIVPIPLYFYRQKQTGRNSSSPHIRQVARYECLESAWSRISLFTSTYSIRCQEPLFLPAFRSLLAMTKSTVSQGNLSNAQYRIKLIKLCLNTIERFIWLDRAPHWWLHIRTYTSSLLKKFNRG